MRKPRVRLALRAREVARVEQHLGEVEAPDREVGRERGHLPEALQGLARTAGLLQQLGEVEGGAVGLGVGRELLLVGGDRLLALAALLVERGRG